jgi:hypothetical protein
MKTVPATLGVLLALLALLAFQRGALAGKVLRVGELRIPLSPAPKAVLHACPPEQPVCVVALVARPAEGGSRITGTIVNSTAQLVTIAPGALAFVGAGGGAAANTREIAIAPGEAFAFNDVSPGLPPSTPLTMVLAVPGLPAIEQPITWIQ